jgi:molecular chaperone DnaK
MSSTIDYGIDLGTTNSSIALCTRGEVRVFQSTSLMNVTPSVIHISKSGRVLVGKQAYDIWVADPQNTQAEFKRWMGYSDKLTFPASARSVSAEELSAEVLKALRADAERQMHAKLNAAVITVPAAFGSLQCEATGRAARMAGFEQSPLLQEPIAAAIAYGASPASRDQRWMIFDLGGGTLDIAIVSTRDGMLAVLEHQGNNRLGGKDIDKAIAQSMLFEPLAKSFHLPDPQKDQAAYRRLMRALVRQAEQIKIALTTDEEATVDLFNMGDDLDQKPIEASFSIKRAEMEGKIAPLIDQCLDLARRALEGARMTGAQLVRVLLVGGPTQMPVVRQALESALLAKLDCSLDPMTVVSHGAALYASGIERTVADPSAPAAAVAAPAGPKAVRVKLAYERASGTRQSPVSGLISDNIVHEVKIDAAGGFWTSGWLPLTGGAFHVDVMLRESKPITPFTLSARDVKGNPVVVTPAEFSISYMLPMSAPPLPHTIAVELSTAHGITKFDSVFARHCPLPSEARKTYKADRTLRPSEVGQSIPIKFWEIEVSDDPQEMWWAGCVHIRAEAIARPIIEGSELELVIKVDPSRKLSVEVFVPMLNQSFTDKVYVPDPPTANTQVQNQLDVIFVRLRRVHEEVYASDRDDLVPALQSLQRDAEAVAEKLGNVSKDDPDAALEPQDRLRQLRMRLIQVEEQLNIQTGSNTLTTHLRWAVPYVGRVVRSHGTEIDKEEFDKIADQYRRYADANDGRGLKWVKDRIWFTHRSIVEDRMWYWQDQIGYLRSPARKYLNRAQADQRIAEGTAAEGRGDLISLRNAVRALWELQAPDQDQAAMEQSSQSGLRGS